MRVLVHIYTTTTGYKDGCGGEEALQFTLFYFFKNPIILSSSVDEEFRSRKDFPIYIADISSFIYGFVVVKKRGSAT